jgi:hypothetical protein
MFKHNVTYTDFNGTERNEDLYFHLSLPEVIRLEAEVGKPMKEYVEELTANMDMKKMLDFLEKTLLNAYGKKTSDGKSFVKNKELRHEFEYSQAYAEVFEQLLTNHDLARKFGQGVADDGKAKKNQVAPTVINE